MDYANYWASAIATADLGETIEQSLRFRNAQQLTRTIATDSAGTTSTFSFWVKFGKEDNSGTETIFSYGGSSYFAYAPTKVLRLYGGAAADCDWTGRARDYSAWYHIVMQGDGNGDSTNNKIWLNGREISTEFNLRDFPGITQGTSSTEFRIGDDTNGNQHFMGYLADFICVNGSAVAPTEFGRYQEDGVWVPKDYSGSYGSKGWRLKFDSSQTNGIGHDSSGNGNHFTATGFDTANVALYSSGLAASSAGSYESNAANRTLEIISPEQAFDGNLAAQCQANGSAAWLYWTTNISCSTVTLIVNNDTDQTPDEIYINGSSVTVPTPTLVGSNYESTVSVSGGTLTEFAFKNQGGPNTSIFGMKVDSGSVLVDNTDNDVDYFDTPTSNYGTWNPLHTAEGNKGAFTDANLQTANNSGGDYIAPSTIACGDGHWYWEVRVDGVQTTGYPMIGIFDYESAKPEWGGGTSNTEGCLYWTTGEFGAFVTQGSQSSYGTSFTTGDIIGVEYNGSNGKLTFYKNGTSQGLATTVVTSRRENMIPGVSAGNNGSAEVSVNFGQMNFIYTMPTGAEKLQTNKLAEPTIKNGKEHFEAIIWTGDGNDNRDITTTESFQPDLVWIKRRSSALDHGLFDSIRGGSKILYPNLGIGEDTSSVNIKQFNSDGFRLGTGAQVNASSETYVAWCWKAGGAPTVDNDNGAGVAQDAGSVKVNGSNSSFAQGSIAVKKMSVNTTAGFSIVEYTGTGSAGTIPHGLGAVPEWAIFKRSDGTADWDCYHQAIGNTKIIKINEDSGQSADGVAYYNNTSPTSTLFTIGAGGANNTSSTEMIAYIWTPIEGYSKFGSYSGGGSGSAPDYDGPFIHLGFKPSWLLIKRSNAAGDPWILLDSTRDTHNFAFQALQPDNSNTEVSSGDQFAIDFLSNGFKCRSSNAAINNSSATYVYAAFAENPFGGENAPPATGR
jgi:hypothetical protein